MPESNVTPLHPQAHPVQAKDNLSQLILRSQAITRLAAFAAGDGSGSTSAIYLALCQSDDMLDEATALLERLEVTGVTS